MSCVKSIQKKTQNKCNIFLESTTKHLLKSLEPMHILELLVCLKNQLATPKIMYTPDIKFNELIE